MSRGQSLLRFICVLLNEAITLLTSWMILPAVLCIFIVSPITGLCTLSTMTKILPNTMDYFAQFMNCRRRRTWNSVINFILWEKEIKILNTRRPFQKSCTQYFLLTPLCLWNYLFTIFRYSPPFSQWQSTLAIRNMNKSGVLNGIMILPKHWDVSDKDSLCTKCVLQVMRLRKTRD